VAHGPSPVRPLPGRSVRCDAATEAAGKLYALGIGIDRLHVRELPARHARMTLVARLAFDADEQGAHPFALRVVDADGQDVTTPVDGELTIRTPDPATNARVNVLIDVVNTEFRTPGPHELTLALDGATVAALPLDVELVPV
jgi:hypothetical protein